MNLLDSIKYLFNVVFRDRKEVPKRDISRVIYSIKSDDLIDIATKCGWIKNKSDSIILNTEKFSADIRRVDYYDNESFYWEVIRDFIRFCKPSWGYKIPFGVEETKSLMNQDALIVMNRYGLFDYENEKMVLWWNKLGNEIRAENNQQKEETGLAGEMLTIKYETNRTGVKPEWISIKSAYAGYDIQSRLDSNDPSEILIEVKTSNQPINLAKFYLTDNEWSVASTSSEQYYIYLWLLREQYLELAILRKNDVEKFIPINNNGGEWKTAAIPFDLFKNKFISLREFAP